MSVVKDVGEAGEADEPIEENLNMDSCRYWADSDNNDFYLVPHILHVRQLIHEFTWRFIDRLNWSARLLYLST